MPQQSDNSNRSERLVDGDSERLLLAPTMKLGAEWHRMLEGSLSQADFAVEGNRRVFVWCSEALAAGCDPTLSGLAHFLVERGDIPEKVTIAWLANLHADAIEISDPAPWLRRVKRLAVEREACTIGQQVAALTASGYEDSREEITALQARMKGLDSRLTETASTGTISDLIERCGGINKLLAKPEGVIPTAHGNVSHLLNGGFRRGQLVLLASRPGVGKSVFALETAIHNSARGRRVVFFSLEMEDQEIFQRSISSVGVINHDDVLSGTLSVEQRHMALIATGKLSGYPLEIVTGKSRLSDILSRMSDSKHGKNDLAVIDYLGLIETGRKSENRNQEISYLTRALKLKAQELKIPILALSQLSRAPETDSREPTLSDLRDSGSLEQDADTVLLLHRPSLMKKRPASALPDEVQVIIAKQRSGRAGRRAFLSLEGQFCRFVERTREDENV